MFRPGTSGVSSTFQFQRSEELVHILPRQIAITEEKLGNGAFGHVYKAYWKGEMIAVKLLNGSCRLALVEEISMLSSIGTHENLVRCLGYVTSPKYGVVMEFVNNGNLFNLLYVQNEEIPPSRKKLILHDISKGMKALHRARVVHRDLKPGNVLINMTSTTFTAKIGDFGLSCKIGRTKEDGSDKVVGSAIYLAPELLNSPPVACSIDVYAFGIMFNEVIEQKIPYGHLKNWFKDTVEALQYAESGRRPLMTKPSTTTLCKIQELIRQCWDKNPSCRPSFITIEESLRKMSFQY